MFVFDGHKPVKISGIISNRKKYIYADNPEREFLPQDRIDYRFYSLGWEDLDYLILAGIVKETAGFIYHKAKAMRNNFFLDTFIVNKNKPCY